MISKKYLMLLSLFLVVLTTNGQNLDIIHLIPRQGIVINTDSILKDRITIEKLCDLYKLKRDTTKLHLELSDWYNIKTGKMEGRTMVFEEFKYRSIIFKFASNTSRDVKVLDYIEIKNPNEFVIYTSDGFSLSGPNPKIQDFYPFVKRLDRVSSDSLTISMNSFGMWIQLMKVKNDELRISNISMRLAGKWNND